MMIIVIMIIIIVIIIIIILISNNGNSINISDTVIATITHNTDANINIKTLNKLSK